jgi:hypothetical protein
MVKIKIKDPVDADLKELVASLSALEQSGVAARLYELVTHLGYRMPSDKIAVMGVTPERYAKALAVVEGRLAAGKKNA